MSNIQVFVQWNKSTVFAGESVECQITFTNISQGSNSHQQSSPNPEVRSATLGRDRWKESIPSPIPNAHFHNTSGLTAKAARPSVGLHRSALSLSPPTGTKNALGKKLRSGAPREISLGGQRHKRSVSIVSIGRDISGGGETYIHSQQLGTKRPGRGHTRSSSLQVLPQRTGVDPDPSSCVYS